MAGIAAFFVLSLLLNMPRDLLYPEYGNVEVWLGFEVTGAAARWTAPIHWAMFAVGVWAFWTCRPWALPVAAAYARPSEALGRRGLALACRQGALSRPPAEACEGSH
jgi:hypothetical protein